MYIYKNNKIIIIIIILSKTFHMRGNKFVSQ